MRLIKRLLDQISPARPCASPAGSRAIPLTTIEHAAPTPVDVYWGQHTVNSTPFATAAASLDYLEWRFAQYPLFREFMDLYGRHDHEVILDYGCGPGNDLIGFLVHTGATKVVGLDISAKALHLARQRLRLHEIDPRRVELVHIGDATVTLPLPDQSFDYVYCEGVLHHTSHPEAILKEFFRVLKPASSACVMVYNYDSLWLHLYTAYQKMILEHAYAGMDVRTAFSKNTDGDVCPISRAYPPKEFIGLCREAGFQADFIGGYFSLLELRLLREIGGAARDDDRLPAEHRDFLRQLSDDERGYPLYRGKHAGIGGVYRLAKPG